MDSSLDAYFEGLPGCKSRNWHAADRGKDIARRAAELRGGVLNLGGFQSVVLSRAMVKNAAISISSIALASGKTA